MFERPDRQPARAVRKPYLPCFHVSCCAMSRAVPCGVVPAGPAVQRRWRHRPRPGLLARPLPAAPRGALRGHSRVLLRAGAAAAGRAGGGLHAAAQGRRICAAGFALGRLCAASCCLVLGDPPGRAPLPQGLGRPHPQDGWVELVVVVVVRRSGRREGWPLGGVARTCVGTSASGEKQAAAAAAACASSSQRGMLPHTHCHWHWHCPMPPVCLYHGGSIVCHRRSPSRSAAHMVCSRPVLQAST